MPAIMAQPKVQPAPGAKKNTPKQNREKVTIVRKKCLSRIHILTQNHQKSPCTIAHGLFLYLILSLTGNLSGGFNGVILLQTEHFHRIFPHLVFEDFPGGIHRKTVDKGDVARGFVLSQDVYKRQT